MSIRRNSKVREESLYPHYPIHDRKRSGSEIAPKKVLERNWIKITIIKKRNKTSAHDSGDERQEWSSRDIGWLGQWTVKEVCSGSSRSQAQLERWIGPRDSSRKTSTVNGSARHIPVPEGDIAWGSVCMGPQFWEKNINKNGPERIQWGLDHAVRLGFRWPMDVSKNKTFGALQGLDWRTPDEVKWRLPVVNSNRGTGKRASWTCSGLHMWLHRVVWEREKLTFQLAAIYCPLPQVSWATCGADTSHLISWTAHYCIWHYDRNTSSYLHVF